jgi:hypothetical protein
MADILVELPDGRKVKFPAGTSRTDMEAAMQAISAAGPAPNPSGDPGNLRLDSPATPPGPKPGALADSFLARGLRGALVSRLDPAAEVVGRGLSMLPGKAGEWGAAELRDIQARNAERSQLQGDSRTRAGDDGMDVAGMVGTGVVDAVTLGPLFRGAKTGIELLKQGAKAGAIAGAVSPVEGSEGKSNEEYARDAAKSAGIGGVAGGVAAPLGAAVISKAADLGTRAVQGFAGAVRRNVAPTSAQQLVRDPRALEAFLAMQAREANVDWTRVPGTVRESLRESARRAVTSTGELPEAAVRNRLMAEAESLPELTLGQATRNPMQFTREANNPNEELRTLFGAQRNAATQKLQNLPNRFGPATTPLELGAGIEASLKNQAKLKKEEVGALYDAFNNSRGALQPLQNSQQFAGDAVTELKQQMLWRQLPQDFREVLEKIYKSGGEEMLNVRQASELRKALNANLTKNGPQTPTDAALSVVKNHLDKMLANPQVRNAEGETAIEGFKAANAARAEMGRWEESSQAIKYLIQRNPKVAQEYVFGRYVLNGSTKDMTGLWKTLPAETQAQVKRAFVQHVTELSMNRTGSEAAGAASTASKFLRTFPKEKLDLMFEKKELASLRNTLEYLRLISEPPAGAFKNTSNSLVDLKDFMSGLNNFPVLGPQVMSPLRQMGKEHELATAMRGGVHVPAAAQAPALLQNVAPRTPAVLSPLTGGAARGPLSSGAPLEEE